ncbi:MAG: hypothetical protein HN341_15670, partial [Verrucomicrobia bacterium]|nr:hypothetical protein [Verrucomicrobiota bacterium]
ALNQDPSGLMRARDWIDRIITLAAAFRKTGEESYRVGAVDYIRRLDDMKSVELRHENVSRGFWLTDGEESACLAIAYDWLYDSLSAKDRKLVVEICRRRLLALGLKRCRKEGEWWFSLRFSNWNAVCAGGLGMLCLAMYDECVEARKILPHVEVSLREFMTPLKDTNGGWPEGLGYWNYGMAYAFEYMLSWERSMGEAHPLMQLPATKKTLSFPYYFYPNSMAAGFGDNNHFHPSPFHYAAAKRLKQERVMGEIDRELTETGMGLDGLMGGSATYCVQHPGTAASKRWTESQVAKVYKGLGWGMIADSMPKPKLYLSMRGGSTTEEHNHVDLLSFRVLVGNEWLIENGHGGSYLQPTFFSKRRTDINDVNATYKNTIFINGVGVPPGSETDSESVVRGDGLYGIRMIATTAMSPDVDATFCGRLALMVDDAAIVVIDRIQTSGISRTEARMHSYKNVVFGKNGALIKGEKESARVTYASLEKAGLFSAVTAPATPTDPSATMIRWCPLMLHKEAVLVMLITPGRYAATASVKRTGKNFAVQITARGVARTLEVKPSLTLA